LKPGSRFGFPNTPRSMRPFHIISTASRTPAQSWSSKAQCLFASLLPKGQEHHLPMLPGMSVGRGMYNLLRVHGAPRHFRLWQDLCFGGCKGGGVALWALQCVFGRNTLLRLADWLGPIICSTKTPNTTAFHRESAKSLSVLLLQKVAAG
jgi:hypothetical protein